MPPLALKKSTWQAAPLAKDVPGAALEPVRLLETPILMGSPVAGPPAVVSVLGALLHATVYGG